MTDLDAMVAENLRLRRELLAVSRRIAVVVNGLRFDVEALPQDWILPERGFHLLGKIGHQAQKAAEGKTPSRRTN